MACLLTCDAARQATRWQQVLAVLAYAGCAGLCWLCWLCPGLISPNVPWWNADKKCVCSTTILPGAGQLATRDCVSQSANHSTGQAGQPIADQHSGVCRSQSFADGERTNKSNQMVRQEEKKAQNQADHEMHLCLIILN
jgi:hypothetical protein